MRFVGFIDALDSYGIYFIICVTNGRLIGVLFWSARSVSVSADRPSLSAMTCSSSYGKWGTYTILADSTSQRGAVADFFCTRLSGWSFRKREYAFRILFSNVGEISDHRVVYSPHAIECSLRVQYSCDGPAVVIANVLSATDCCDVLSLPV